MIKLLNKSYCCGCSACLQICPKHSISFNEDKEGFLYPNVDTSTCIDCGLCEKVCPVINQNDERLPLQVFAAKHPNDEIRLSSSSGGIFTLLAEQIIDEGGVVFGARFNEKWEVVHDFAETKEGLIPFRGSKYVQSRIGDAYANAEKFLKSGRKVMFTGTPCQIAGLKKYLRREYENLLAVDFVCHGVPSPMVWRKYIQEEIAHQDKCVLTKVNFRDKSTGWKKFSFILNFSQTKLEGDQNLIRSSVFTDNAYMNAFLENLSLRPCCYACPAKAGKSESDITIGDFWGIEKIASWLDDDKGISLVLLSNINKLQVLPINSIDFVQIPLKEALKHNIVYYQSVKEPINRNYFFLCVIKRNATEALYRVTNTSILRRVRRVIFRKFGI